MVDHQVYDLGRYEQWGTLLVYWDNMHDGDQGVPYIAPHLADKSVEVNGTFGIGGTCVLMGRIHPEAQYQVLYDVHGRLCQFTEPTIVTLRDLVYDLYPSVTGDTNTSLTVSVLFSAKGRR